MATISENIAIIQAKASELDALVDQFRSAKGMIDAAEAEIRHERGSVVAKAGQERLADYGHSLMVKPSIGSDMTVAQVAAAAWEGVV